MVRRRQPAEPKAARRSRKSGARVVGAARTTKLASSFEQALEAVVQFARKVGAPAAVIGGVAVIAHGFARATADIDLAIAIQPTSGRKVLAIARQAKLIPRIDHALEFAEENLVLLLQHQPTRTPVDVSFALQPFERESLESAIERTIGSVRVRVAPLSALLIYKMVASRTKDLEDVDALLSTGAPYDKDLVLRTLAELDAVLETSRVADFIRLAGSLRRAPRRRSPPR